MNRGTSVYIVTFVVLGVGLWLVFRVGSQLRAPTDLSGKWEIRSTGSTVPAKVMAVEQSGKYFQVRFDGSDSIDMKLSSEEVNGPDADPTVAMTLTGGPWEIKADGHPEQDQMNIRLRTPKAPETTFAAVRTERSMPAKPKVAEAGLTP